MLLLFSRIVPSSSGIPTNAYTAEDGVTYYVAENGSTYYIQEPAGPPRDTGQPMGLLLLLTYT